MQVCQGTEQKTCLSIFVLSSSRNIWFVKKIEILLRPFVLQGRPGTKPDVYENGFPSFKTQILCLQFYVRFLSSS